MPDPNRPPRRYPLTLLLVLLLPPSASARDHLWPTSKAAPEHGSSAPLFRTGEEDIWKGSIDITDEASIAAGVARLKAAMPEFRWDQLPERMTRDDLPALITVQTITEYMRKRLNVAGSQ